MNLLGQRIMDKSYKVFHSAYFDTKWYLMPPKIRRYIHVILINSTKCSNITAEKMGEVSLEAAGIVISMKILVF